MFPKGKLFLLMRKHVRDFIEAFDGEFVCNMRFEKSVS